MSRRAAGSAYQKRGVWYWAVRLRTGKQHARPVPKREDGRAITEAFARSFAETRQHDYDAGAWDPHAPAKLAPAPTTVAAYAREWAKAQTYSSAAEDRRRVEHYIAGSAFGAMRLGDVKPRHVLAFVDELRARKSEKGGTLAPRTVRNVYSVVRRAFDRAVFDELIVASPCKLPPKALPGIEDKDPTAREGWVFTRAEAEALISSPLVPPDRRVVYALLLLTGARFGELAALRWSAYDAAATPLGRLTIARSIERETRAEKGTKTGAVRRVPVHPTLAAVLAGWKLAGWAACYGRAPTGEDWVVPASNGSARRVIKANEFLTADLAALGYTRRHLHCTRRTFVSLCRDDGARGDLLRWITHTPPRAILDQYTTPAWDTLCAEVSRLRLERWDVSPAVSLTTRATTRLAIPSPMDARLLRNSRCGQQDLKPSARVGKRQ